jgi:3-oxoacyl-[acyl-carrier-protein] synthase-3
MKAYIKAISYYLPELVVTNEELVREFPEWTVEKIADKVGVTQRHIAGSETITDMAVRACERLFAEHGIDRGEVDFILLCTQSPDYFLPTSACVVQDRLGISTSAGALDFNLGCSGYVYGLALAKGLIAAGVARNILLVTSEAYSKHVHPADKGNRTIFGDAASATLISTEGLAEVREFVLGTDGTGAENLIVKTGALKYPAKAGDPLSDNLYMNGAEIFTFTLDAVPPLVRQTLKRNAMTESDIGLWVFHQANRYMIDVLRNKLKIEPEKFSVHLEKTGNTVSSTIPIALCEEQKQDRLHGNILLAGFGVGYSWGGVVIKA